MGYPIKDASFWNNPCIKQQAKYKRLKNNSFEYFKTCTNYGSYLCW